MMMIFTYLGLFLLTCSFLAVFYRYALKKEDLIDHPNHRSSHVLAKPRGGGVVFVVIWLLFAIIVFILRHYSLRYALSILPGSALIALSGYLDDLYKIRARWRFVVQIIAAFASLFILGGYTHFILGEWTIELGWIGSVLAFLLLVWSTNLFNFMDGTDGIAGVEAVFVFGIGGLFLWFAGGYTLALLAWGLAASVMGFLCWNWPPARLFMGDAGSSFLGFLVILFALAGEKWYGVPALLWLLLYGAFIFDATVTLIRRLLAGEKWYQAHRLHAYQRLHQAGWSHAKVLGGLIKVNIILVALAIIGFYYANWMVWILLFTLIFLTSVYILIERVKPMYLNKK